MTRDFACLFQGQLVSHFGTQAFSVMALYWLSQLTGTPTAGAAFMALTMLPPIVLGPWLVRKASTMAPRSVLMRCEAVAAAAAAPVAVAMWLGAPAGVLVTMLLATTAALSTCNAILMPNLHAAIPLVVPRERLSQANSWVTVTQQLATVLGQGLGGALYAALGPAALCATTSIGFALSSTAASRMRGEAVSRARPDAAAAGPSFQLVRSNRELRDLTITSAIFNLLYAPWLILLPFHLAPQSALGPATYGIALAAYGSGNMLGALALKRLASKFRGGLLGWCLAGQGVSLSALGLAHGLPAICAVLVVMGAGMSLANILLTTRVQTSVEQQQIAPAMAIMRAGIYVATPLGLGAAALLRTAAGLEAGTVYLVLGCVLIASIAPRLKAIAERDPAAGQQAAEA